MKSEILLDMAKEKRNTLPVLPETGDVDCYHDSYSSSELLEQRSSSRPQETFTPTLFPDVPAQWTAGQVPCDHQGLDPNQSA